MIGGEEVRTGDTFEAVMPHRKEPRPRRRAPGRRRPRSSARSAAADAWHDWSRTPWEERAAVFLRAAELLAGPWRSTLNAATMLGQSKTAHQAEIDAACELIDFFRFNVEFMTRIYEEQPVSSPGVWNRLEYRPLEGFVFAVSPFNFTAIGGNLPTSPALMGNTVVWKPASTAALSAWYTMRLFEEAGLPPRRDQPRLRAGRGDRRPRARQPRPRRRPLHRLDRRLPVDVEDGRREHRARTATTRASSARPAARTSSSPTRPPTSTRSRRRSSAARSSTRARSARPPRASTRPSNLWPRAARAARRARSRAIKMGDVADFSNFMGAVIDARLVRDAEGGDRGGARARRPRSLVGGGYDDSEGWFVEPTVIETATRASACCATSCSARS